MADENRKLHSIVKIDGAEYDIIAAKVANSLSIKVGDSETAFDGSAAKTINIKGSGATTVAEANGIITINSTDTKDGNDNQTVKVNVPNGTDIAFGKNDVVEFVAGSNVTITGNASDKTITISATGGGSQADLSNYATKSYVDDAIDNLEEVIPTRTGQLTNDSGYLTSIPVTMDSGDTFTTITISKNEPSNSNGYVGDIWFKY